MAEEAPQHQTDLAPVRARLADAQPMCLALLAIESAADGRPVRVGGDSPLDETVAARLRQCLRLYDDFLFLGDRVAIFLPTLAGAAILANRVTHVHQTLQAPYAYNGAPIEVRVVLGAAVRDPQEDAETFLARTLATVEAARAGGARAPVLV